MDENIFYYDIEPGKGCLGRFLAMLIGLLICLGITLATSSCSRKMIDIESEDYVYVDKFLYESMKDSISSQRNRIVSLEKEKVRVDSIYIGHTDSTVIFVNGDTVFKTKYVHDIIYKESKESTETINSLVDSIETLKIQNSEYVTKIDSIKSNKRYEMVTKEIKVIPLWLKLVFGILLLSVFIIIFIVRKRFF